MPAPPAALFDPDLAGAVDHQFGHVAWREQGSQRREVVFQDSGVVHHLALSR